MYDILVIDDKDTWSELIIETVGYQYRCDTANNFDEALRKINVSDYRLVCTNLEVPTDGDGQKILTLLRTEHPEMPVVVITGSGVFVGAVETITRNSDNLREEYPNIKEIIVKGTKTGNDFLADLLKAVSRILGAGVTSRSWGEEHSPVVAPTSTEGRSSPRSVKTTISWLHLSDLHIGVDERAQDWKKLGEALLQDVKNHYAPIDMQPGYLAGVTFRPDFLFITGDIAFRSTEAEYQDASSFLHEIWEITGLGKSQTYMVPGNHDVVRSIAKNQKYFTNAFKTCSGMKGDNDQEAWVKEVSEFCEDEYFLDLLRQKSSTYLEFAKNHSNQSDGEMWYVSKVPVNGESIEIVGVNSSLMSWIDGEDTRRELWIGDPQLTEIKNALSEDASMRITLVHHPSESLHEQDVEWNWSRLTDISHVLLHGHLHRPRVKQEKEPENHYVYISGGSVHLGGIWQRQHYSYCELDLETGDLTVYMRMTNSGVPEPIYIRDILTYPKAGSTGYVEFQIPVA